MSAHAFLLGVLLLGAAAAAHGDAPTAERIGRAVGAALFTEEERETLRGYFYGTDRDGERREGHGHEPPESGGSKGKWKVESEERPDKAKGKSKGKSKDRSGLPPGLAKKDELPPGLARKLERDGHLPPGLEKRALPQDLESRLPPPWPGHERVVVDRDVVLIETATGIIKDILRDIVR